MTTAMHDHVACAEAIVRHVVPKIPTLFGRDPVPFTMDDTRAQLAELFVRLLRDGLSAEGDVISVFLASVVTTRPGALVTVVELALESLQGYLESGIEICDADGTVLPRVERNNDWLATGGIVYVIADEDGAVS